MNLINIMAIIYEIIRTQDPSGTTLDIIQIDPKLNFIRPDVIEKLLEDLCLFNYIKRTENFKFVAVNKNDSFIDLLKEKIDELKSLNKRKTNDDTDDYKPKLNNSISIERIEPKKIKHEIINVDNVPINVDFKKFPTKGNVFDSTKEYSNSLGDILKNVDYYLMDSDDGIIILDFDDVLRVKFSSIYFKGLIKYDPNDGIDLENQYFTNPYIKHIKNVSDRYKTVIITSRDKDSLKDIVDFCADYELKIRSIISNVGKDKSYIDKADLVKMNGLVDINDTFIFIDDNDNYLESMSKNFKQSYCIKYDITLEMAKKMNEEERKKLAHENCLLMYPDK